MFSHHPCSNAHLSSQNAVNHDNDEALQGVKDCEEDLEESRTAVGDGQHCRHPGEGQQRKDYTGAPEGCPGKEKEKEKERSLGFWTSPLLTLPSLARGSPTRLSRRSKNVRNWQDGFRCFQATIKENYKTEKKTENKARGPVR